MRKVGVTSILLSLSVVPLGLGCRAENGISDLVERVPTTHPATLGLLVKSQSARCTGPDREAGTQDGHVVYRLPDGHVYRQPALPGAAAMDVTRALGELGAGKDGFIATSPDGAWLLVQTTRFGCGEDMCIAAVDSRVCSAQVIVAGSDAVRPESYSIIGGAKGNVVVFAARGNHPADLFAVTRTPTGWSAVKNVTQASPSPFNKQPAISPDGTHILFDCGNDPGAGLGTSICEVGVDGTGLRIAVSSDGADGTQGANHHAGYAPDGIVFEGTWAGGAEQVWHIAPGGAPALVNTEPDPEDDSRPRFTDDNSPCVFPDGRVASLWLGRRANGDQLKASGHELKVMNGDGSAADMLLTGVDVVDIGIGCSK